MDEFKKFALCVGLVLAMAFVAVCLLIAFLYQAWVAYGLASAGVLAAIRWLVLPIARGASEIYIGLKQPYRCIAPDARGNYPIVYHQSGMLHLPSGRRCEVVDTTAVVEQDATTLPALPSPTMYKLSDQLRCEETTPNEDTSIVGYVQGEPLRGALFAVDGNMMDSIYVAGDSGSGKSCLAVYLAALCILQGGKLLVIDPDWELNQSLTKRLGPLASMEYLLAPIGTDPDRAAYVLKVAENALEHPTMQPVLLLIDEFSMIMRHAENGGKWGEAGKRASDVAENFATRGRKRRLKAVVFGQITKANRSGGTELRDSMTTFLFRLKKKRAGVVLDDVEDATQVPDLKDGEAFVIPARSSEDSYRMQLTFPDKDGLEMVVRIAKQGGNTLETDTETGTETAIDAAPTKIIDGIFEPSEPSTETLPDLAVSPELRETIRRLNALTGPQRMAHRTIAQVVGLGGRKYGIYRAVCAELGIVIKQEA